MENENKEALEAKISILKDLAQKKDSSVKELSGLLKQFEVQSATSRELFEKLDAFVVNKRVDIKSNIRANSEIEKNLLALVEKTLEEIRAYARLTFGQPEKLYVYKQSEILFMKNEIEELNLIKDDCEKSLNEILLKKEEMSKELNADVKDVVDEKKARKKRVRPDQDPTTAAGRAVMDLVKRKKTAAKLRAETAKK